MGLRLLLLVRLFIRGILEEDTLPDECIYEADASQSGNHELSLDPSYDPDGSSARSIPPEERRRCRELLRNIPGVTYLEHTSTTIHLPSSEEIEGGDPRTINIFGSPYSASDLHSNADESPEGGSIRSRNNWAFQYHSSKAGDVWCAIPEGTDILITHTPPAGHCDQSKYWTRGGCPTLLNRLREVRPMLHVCGHCHEGRGAEVTTWPNDETSDKTVRQWQDPGAGSKKLSLFDLTGSKGGQRLEKGKETAVVNACIMGKSYERREPKEMRKPIVVDIFL